MNTFKILTVSSFCMILEAVALQFFLGCDADTRAWQTIWRPPYTWYLYSRLAIISVSMGVVLIPLIVLWRIERKSYSAKALGWAMVLMVSGTVGYATCITNSSDVQGSLRTNHFSHHRFINLSNSLAAASASSNRPAFIKASSFCMCD